MTSAPPRRAHLIIVDPDKDVREALAAFLSERHEVATADTARAALALIAKGNVDAVISDMNLPDQFAPGFFLEARSRLPHGVLVALYQYGDQGQAREPHVRRVADLVLSKPFDLEKLREALDTLLQRSGGKP